MEFGADSGKETGTGKTSTRWGKGTVVIVRIGRPRGARSANRETTA
jgi:hypothetical protein